MSLFGELKRRNVFRVGAAYAVGGWLVIQVAETIMPAFGLGDTALRIVVIALSHYRIVTLCILTYNQDGPNGFP